MIDTHSHILAGLDDGAATMEETLGLLEQAVEEGITGIIATPHGHHPNFPTDVPKMQLQLEATRQLVLEKNLPLEIYSGQECRLSDKLPERLASGEALPLAESRYVLLELPSNGVPAYTVQIIQELIASNYIPIIAHAERNQGIIEKPERLSKLLLHGAVAQVTAGSVAGTFGKAIQKTAMSLINANLIHVYGSDVHHLERRPFHFIEGLDYLEKKKLGDVAEILLENNERIVNNEQLIILEPQSIKITKWWDILG
ncbi:capsular biosynthesis protein [Planococcus sp. APC 3906]|uniref:tyrosine-protein phosphatase n=1 Tax=Planococcus sp. APC 3906 TaxID=3035194 RepID=UPI0025B5F953|nr:CpsB/CapC family capsule biosynthesis tyrosine phosphatase [Planococcus sp. APC 3906]MDN3451559.1 capsular biosynthesis protein [Planococcus sp. APC 3906]